MLGTAIRPFGWETPESAVDAMFLYESTSDRVRVAMPRPEVHIIARYGPPGDHFLDAHAFGVSSTVRRKVISAGQRAVTARLRLGASQAVLGVPASAMAGGIFAIEDLWGVAAARDLLDRLDRARSLGESALVLESAIARRVSRSDERAELPDLLSAAARRLPHRSVVDVAYELGVSDRHLRREFRKTVGMTPKAYANLARFNLAVDAARRGRKRSWAQIAADTGYYDQSHLIEQFRKIAGVTPNVLLGELDAVPGA